MWRLVVDAVVRGPLRGRKPGARSSLMSAVLAGLLLLGPNAASAAPVLLVEQITGAASLTRSGQLSALKAGAALQQDDLISTTGGGRLMLKLSRYGLIELGPGAAVSIGPLPASSYASDLSTGFRLRQGYLHFIWKRPELVTPWPVLVQVGEFRLSLTSGDYHFEVADKSKNFCVGEGEVALPSAEHPLPFSGPACYPLVAGYVPQPSPRVTSELIAMRQHNKIGRVVAAAGVPMVKLLPPLQARAKTKTVPSPAPAKTLPQPLAKSRPKLLPEPEIKVASKPAPKAKIKAVAHAKPAAKMPPMSKGGAWLLNVSSESNMASAQHEVSRLGKAGYTAEIEAIKIQERQWYRVQIRNLESSQKASVLSRQVAQKLGYSSIWVSSK